MSKQVATPKYAALTKMDNLESMSYEQDLIAPDLG
jgi:hypothetical protein